MDLRNDDEFSRGRWEFRVDPQQPAPVLISSGSQSAHGQPSATNMQGLGLSPGPFLLALPQGKCAEVLRVALGMPVDFAVNQDGEVVIQKAEGLAKRKPDRFEAARGKADAKWRTQDLMALLRGDMGNVA